MEVACLVALSTGEHRVFGKDTVRARCRAQAPSGFPRFQILLRHDKRDGFALVHAVVAERRDRSGRYRNVHEPRHLRRDRQQLAIRHPVLTIDQGILHHGLDRQEATRLCILLPRPRAVFGGCRPRGIPDVVTEERHGEPHDIGALGVDPHVARDERRADPLRFHSHLERAYAAARHQQLHRIRHRKPVVLHGVVAERVQCGVLRHAHQADAVAERTRDEPWSVHHQSVPQFPFRIAFDVAAEPLHDADDRCGHSRRHHLHLEIIGRSPRDLGNRLVSYQRGLSGKAAATGRGGQSRPDPGAVVPHQRVLAHVPDAGTSVQLRCCGIPKCCGV